MDHFKEVPEGHEKVRIFDADGSVLEAIYYLSPEEVRIALATKLILPKVKGATEHGNWEYLRKFKQVLGRGPDA